MMRFPKLFLLLMTLMLGGFFILQGGCSSINPSSTQNTKMLQVNPFVSQLYGSSAKQFSVQVQTGTHIAWMGLERSGDYRYFLIQDMKIAGKPLTPKTIDPTYIEENVTVTPAQNAQANAMQDVTFTVSYSPTKAVAAENKPHRAYLLIVIDSPEQTIVRVELLGYTRGVVIGKCTNGVGRLEKIAYKPVNDKIKLYLCDSNAIPPAYVTPGAPGERTNLAEIPVNGEFVFYKADNESVCFIGPDGDKPDPQPTVPAFDIPIPEGIDAPVDSLPVILAPNSAKECSLADNAITCNASVSLEVMNGLVPVTPLTITNGATTPGPALQEGATITPDCAGFPEMTGAGALGDDTMTLIGWGVVLKNQNTEEFKVDGALVVAEIPLEKVN